MIRIYEIDKDVEYYENPAGLFLRKDDVLFHLEKILKMSDNDLRRSLENITERLDSTFWLR